MWRIVGMHQSYLSTLPCYVDTVVSEHTFDIQRGRIRNDNIGGPAAEPALPYEPRDNNTVM